MILIHSRCSSIVCFWFPLWDHCLQFMPLNHAFINHVDFYYFHLCPSWIGHDRGSWKPLMRSIQAPSWAKVPLGSIFLQSVHSLHFGHWADQQRDEVTFLLLASMLFRANICMPKSSYWPKREVEAFNPHQVLPWSVSFWSSNSTHNQPLPCCSNSSSQAVTGQNQEVKIYETNHGIVGSLHGHPPLPWTSR